MAKDFYGDEIPPGGHEISKLWLAMKALDRREFDECLGYCNAVLEKNPYDQQVWYVKTRCLTLKMWVDDTELEEEGVAEVLMDENATAAMPRPGTSLRRPGTRTQTGMPNQGIRPTTSSGRPMTGFLRPGTSN